MNRDLVKNWYEDGEWLKKHLRDFDCNVIGYMVNVILNGPIEEELDDDFIRNGFKEFKPFDASANFNSEDIKF